MERIRTRIRTSSGDGVLVVDKPAGPASHDIVARVRSALGEPRVGHTGTLDPFATGPRGFAQGPSGLPCFPVLHPDVGLLEG